ncbi:MAG: hypothetical protein LBV51_05470 [Acholeplasmatales bacterium]|jgi:hypothetical protein|nr:hypothetical protein [Acholeplasmatales bacterium]
MDAHKEETYQDYTLFLEANKQLISSLNKISSHYYHHFHPSIVLLDYLYNKVIDDPKFSIEEDLIFNFGYSYFKECIINLKDIISKTTNDESFLESQPTSVLYFLLLIDRSTFYNDTPTIQTDFVKYINEVKDIIIKQKNISIDLQYEIEAFILNLPKRKVDIENEVINDILLDLYEEYNLD